MEDMTSLEHDHRASVALAEGDPMRDEPTTQAARAARLAGRWWADRLSPGYASHADSFAAQVELYVLSELMEHGECATEVDYQACDLLDKALHYAGINAGRLMAMGGPLPTKHELVVRADRLEPKEGYGNWTAHIQVP